MNFNLILDFNNFSFEEFSEIANAAADEHVGGNFSAFLCKRRSTLRNRALLSTPASLIRSE